MDHLIAARPPTLQQQVSFWISQGYRVVSATDESAQLVKPKTFSFFWFLVWTVCSLGTLFWVYLAWWLAKRESTVYLAADQRPRVS